MEIATTRMSSKGQVVISSELRENISEGEQLIIIKNNNQIILKKTSELGKNLKEDLEFAKRKEEAFKRHEKGQFKGMDFDEFISEMKKL